MSSGLTYLSCPYNDPNLVVKQQRIVDFCRADAMLSSLGKFTVSPMLKLLVVEHENLPDTYEYWSEYCQALLKKCDEMIVVTIAGWDTSVGVMEEMKLAKRLGIPIRYLNLSLGWISDYITAPPEATPNDTRRVFGSITVSLPQAHGELGEVADAIVETLQLADGEGSDPD